MLVRLTTRLVLASLTAMTGKGDPLFLFSTFDAPQALGFTVATGINNSGQVVGYFSGSNGYRGFLYAQNQFTVLNVPMAGAPASQYAGGINDLGQIVGFYDPQGGGGGFLRGFLYSGGAYSDVVPPLADGGVHVNGISDGQQIVGDYSRERSHGFVAQGGAYTTLDYPAAVYTVAHGINKSGVIVGTYQSSSDLTTYGFVYENGAFGQLDNPLALHTPSLGTSAFGINAMGVIVGNYISDSNGSGHGFVYRAGQYVTVDYPGATSTGLLGINDKGQMVGSYQDGTGVHGFIATPLLPVSITTIPVGLALSVDGETISTPRTFTWALGSTHSLTAITQQDFGPTRHVFTGWSDGLAASHLIVVGQMETYTGTFATQFLLTTSVFPPGSGVISTSPSSMDGYFAAAQAVQLTETPSINFEFSSWSGDLSGPASQLPLVMTGPKSVTAAFNALPTCVYALSRPSASVSGLGDVGRLRSRRRPIVPGPQPLTRSGLPYTPGRSGEEVGWCVFRRSPTRPTPPDPRCYQSLAYPLQLRSRRRPAHSR